MLQLEVREKELIKYVSGNGDVHVAVCTLQGTNSTSFPNWIVALADLVSPDKLQRLGNCWRAGRGAFGVNSCWPLSEVTGERHLPIWCWHPLTHVWREWQCCSWTVCQGPVPAVCRRNLEVSVSSPSRAIRHAVCSLWSQFLSSGSRRWRDRQLMWFFFFPWCFRREQAVEKKYPGTYKRHPVRPIIHPNTVEKLMKRKGVSHKPGSQTKRWEVTTQSCARASSFPLSLMKCRVGQRAFTLDPGLVLRTIIVKLS